MTDIRLPASGNIMVRWHAVNAFANPASPTPTEINAGLKLGDAISWNDWSFGIQASDTNKDPAITSKSNEEDRGVSKYGGSLSFYYPEDFADSSNQYKLVYDAISPKRVIGYVSMTVDGELSENSTATYSGGVTQTALSGDFAHIMKVQTGGWTDAIVGTNAFRYTISFLPQGEIHPFAVISTTPTTVVSPATATVATGAHAVLKATSTGREWTRGMKWTSADTSKVTVSQNGVVSRTASGTVVITATNPNTGVSGTSSIS